MATTTRLKLFKPRLLTPAAADPGPGRGRKKKPKPPTAKELIDRLDELYCDDEFGALLGRDSPDPNVRLASLMLFGRVAAKLFPDDFLSPEEAVRVPPGLFPRQCEAA